MSWYSSHSCLWTCLLGYQIVQASSKPYTASCTKWLPNSLRMETKSLRRVAPSREWIAELNAVRKHSAGVSNGQAIDKSIVSCVKHRKDHRKTMKHINLTHKKYKYLQYMVWWYLFLLHSILRINYSVYEHNCLFVFRSKVSKTQLPVL